MQDLTVWTSIIFISHLYNQKFYRVGYMTALHSSASLQSLGMTFPTGEKFQVMPVWVNTYRNEIILIREGSLIDWYLSPWQRISSITHISTVVCMIPHRGLHRVIPCLVSLIKKMSYIWPHSCAEDSTTDQYSNSIFAVKVLLGRRSMPHLPCGMTWMKTDN